VHATADGRVVVLHDATVDRTTNGTGAVKAMSLSALQDLDAGFAFTAPDGSHPFRGQGIRVPTLREVLAASHDVPLNIEIKQDDPPIVERVLGDLDRFRARERTLLAAEYHHIMERIRSAAPAMLTGASSAEVADFVFSVRDDLLDDYRPLAFALQVPPAYEGTPIVTAQTVAVAHRFGLEVHVWTINDEAEMERLLDLGVDALMSDFPERGMAVLRRAGRRA